MSSLAAHRSSGHRKNYIIYIRDFLQVCAAGPLSDPFTHTLLSCDYWYEPKDGLYYFFVYKPKSI